MLQEHLILKLGQFAHRTSAKSELNWTSKNREH